MRVSGGDDQANALIELGGRDRDVRDALTDLALELGVDRCELWPKLDVVEVRTELHSRGMWIPLVDRGIGARHVTARILGQVNGSEEPLVAAHGVVEEAVTATDVLRELITREPDEVGQARNLLERGVRNGQVARPDQLHPVRHCDRSSLARGRCARTRRLGVCPCDVPSVR